jgi:hypothetical protein
MVVHAYNPSTGVAEAGGSVIEARLDYKAKFCLNKKENNNNKKLA